MPDIKHFDPDATLDTVLGLFWRQGMASTGVQDIVAATGLNRSSLYATFGGKHELYLAALRRYVDQRSQPMLQRLSGDERGLPAVSEFFAGLIKTRCSGEYARWGCMVANAHAGVENGDDEVRAILDRHHRSLRQALLAALAAAGDRHQLAPGVGIEGAAEMLALLAYGVNIRSRAGADARELETTVNVALASITDRAGDLGV